LSNGAWGRIIVSMPNDNMPALGLRQCFRFRITGIVPGRIAAHHGGEFSGFSGIPVRDEIILAWGIEI
jgi:hypothetical protein